MSDAAGWIRARLADAPPALVHAMVAAVPDDASLAVPDALAEGALSLYAALRDGGGGREDALPLLAADALFTHALEAQADADPDALPALAARIGGAGALGRLVGG